MQELPFLRSASRLMLIDICMKVSDDSFRGFQVTERTRFVTDRRTDTRTDGQTPGEKQYVSQPFGGRHKKVLEWSQHFSHCTCTCKSMGIFLDSQGQLILQKQTFLLTITKAVCSNRVAYKVRHKPGCTMADDG